MTPSLEQTLSQTLPGDDFAAIYADAERALIATLAAYGPDHARPLIDYLEALDVAVGTPLTGTPRVSERSQLGYMRKQLARAGLALFMVSRGACWYASAYRGDISVCTFAHPDRMRAVRGLLQRVAR